MKNLILRWLGLGHILDVRDMVEEVKKLKKFYILDSFELSNYRVKYKDEIDDIIKKVLYLETANENRKKETSEIIETLQNLDNNEVIRDLHNRIKKLEEQS